MNELHQSESYERRLQANINHILDSHYIPDDFQPGTTISILSNYSTDSSALNDQKDSDRHSHKQQWISARSMKMVGNDKLVEMSYSYAHNSDLSLNQESLHNHSFILSNQSSNSHRGKGKLSKEINGSSELGKTKKNPHNTDEWKADETCQIKSIESEQINYPSDCGASFNSEKSDLSLNDFTEIDPPSWCPVLSASQSKKNNVQAWLKSIEKYKNSNCDERKNHHEREIAEKSAISVVVPLTDEKRHEEVEDFDSVVGIPLKKESQIKADQDNDWSSESDHQMTNCISDVRKAVTGQTDIDEFELVVANSNKSDKQEGKVGAQNRNTFFQFGSRKSDSTTATRYKRSPPSLEEMNRDRIDHKYKIHVQSSHLNQVAENVPTNQEEQPQNVKPFFLCHKCSKIVPSSLGTECQYLSCNAHQSCGQIFHGIADLMMHFTIFHKNEVRQFRWCLGCSALLPKTHFTSHSDGPGLCTTCIPLETKKFKMENHLFSQFSGKTKVPSLNDIELETEKKICQSEENVVQQTNDSDTGECWTNGKTLFINNNHAVDEREVPQINNSASPNRTNSKSDSNSKVITSRYITKHPNSSDKRLLAVTNEIRLQFLMPDDSNDEWNYPVESARSTEKKMHSIDPKADWTSLDAKDEHELLEEPFKPTEMIPTSDEKRYEIPQFSSVQVQTASSEHLNQNDNNSCESIGNVETIKRNFSYKDGFIENGLKIVKPNQYRKDETLLNDEFSENTIPDYDSNDNPKRLVKMSGGSDLKDIFELYCKYKDTCKRMFEPRKTRVPEMQLNFELGKKSKGKYEFYTPRRTNCIRRQASLSTRRENDFSFRKDGKLIFGQGNKRRSYNHHRRSFSEQQLNYKDKFYQRVFPRDTLDFDILDHPFGLHPLAHLSSKIK